MQKVSEFHRQSIENKEEFWAREAQRIHWQTPFERVLDYSRPPFARWFVGGRTNLCFNAVDRWLQTRGDQAALVWISTETEQEIVYSYQDLAREVNAAAAILQELGVGQGDRVLIYLPMIPQAAFFMLACARLGAIHSVVFGGFAAHNLAQRINDARPKVLVSTDAGSRGGRPVPYKPLLDQAIAQCEHAPEQVVLIDRGLVPMEKTAGRDLDYAALRARHLEAKVAVQWLESNEPSYILYTSGTTGNPKGVQRDVGGYAVALCASMEYIYGGKPGDVFFSSSDVGWVVGHSYVVYGPLLNGQTTIMYEGTPIHPDAAILWRIVEDYKVSAMFSAPTAIRVLKKHDPALLRRHDLSSLQRIYLAGEPLDELTGQWLSQELGKPVIDNYWQTETGWPIISAQPGIEDLPLRFGSPSVPVYGFDVRIIDEVSGEDCGPGRKGVVAMEPPLPPGVMSTIWGNDARFVDTYFKSFPGRLAYSSSDWGIFDQDGYWFILGRTDDVINVAGHRLGTREIEESVNTHPAVAESAVVGVADELKGQVAVAFVVLRNSAPLADDAAAQLAGEINRVIEQRNGAVARPARVLFVNTLPKTRSGKVLRRAIVALCEGRDPGDLTTIEDPGSLEQIRAAL